MRRNSFLLKFYIACLASFSLGLTGCGGSDEQANQNNPAMKGGVPVDVQLAKTMDVDVTSTLIGRTVSVKNAEVRPQVTGIILKRMFTEGSEVKEGQQLYQIDPALYQAQLESAKAQLESAKATLYTTKLRYDRYSQLIKTKAISQQDYDDAQANYLTAKASILSAEANVKTAQINLAYTKVYAPISGIIGRSSVTEGALVTNGQANALATIQQLDPMYIDLGKSANDHLQQQQDLIQGKFIPNTEKNAEIYFEDGSVFAQKGKQEFSEVNVDPSTGMIITRLSVPNPNKLLLPGMYIKAKINEGVKKDAVVIPQIALLRQTNGSTIVYTVSKKNCPPNVATCVGLNMVETAGEIGNNYIISSGINAGDEIITTNLQKIGPGVPITPIYADKAPSTNNKK